MKRILAFFVALTVALCFTACTVSVVGPYVVQAYKVVNDAIGVAKDIQAHPEQVTSKIGPVIQALEVVRTALANAAAACGASGQLPDPKTVIPDGSAQLSIDTAQLNALNAKVAPKPTAPAASGAPATPSDFPKPGK